MITKFRLTLSNEAIELAKSQKKQEHIQKMRTSVTPNGDNINNMMQNNGQMHLMKQKFFNQFYLLNGLSKLRNLENYRNREDLFKNVDPAQSILSEQSLNTQAFETVAVQNYTCDHSWPICIYDFTFGLIYPQFFCFKIQDEIKIIPNYFKNDTDDKNQPQDIEKLNFNSRPQIT